MRRTTVLPLAFGILLSATLWAQVQPPPAPRAIAIRAGRLFDSKAGRVLTKQVVVVSGERIAEVGPEAQVKIPPGALTIDFSQATVLPGLIDAHTHMFNTRGPKSTTES